MSGCKRSGLIRASVILLLAIPLALPTNAVGHPELDSRIRFVTARLEQTPADAHLLVYRGELHAEHEDWGAALDDFALAAEVDPAYIAVDFHRGRLLHRIEEFAEAESALARFLRNARGTRDSSLPVASAHLLLGELMERTERWRQAAVHYDKGIRLAPNTDPGFYIARARAQVNTAEPNYELALQGLDGRLRQLPGLYTLAEYAVQIELKRGNVVAAETRIEGLIKAYPSLARWRLQLAGMQQNQGREQDARSTYLDARRFIRSLPEHAQAKLRRQGIEADINRGLRELR